jgi:hypothetical protein
MNKAKNQRFLACRNRHSHLNKRGSHVGMILSLVIFITFLVFLYTTLEPIIKTQKDKGALLDYLQIELTEKFSADLTSIVISSRGGDDGKDNCIEINYNEIGIENPANISVVIYDEFNNPIGSNFEEVNLIVNKFDDKKEFFKIYYSEEELNNSAEFNVCQKIIGSGEMTFGQIKTRKHIFESKIISLINEYDKEYGGLKEELKIPLGSEFGLSFTYSNETVIETSEGDILTNVYSEEVPIQYIDEKASTNAGFMSVRVW